MDSDSNNTHSFAQLLSQGKKGEAAQLLERNRKKSFGADQRSHDYPTINAEEGSQVSASYGSHSLPFRSSNDITSDLMKENVSISNMICHCGFLVQSRTVTSGLHTAEEFFCCNNPNKFQTHCDFFEWADPKKKVTSTLDGGVPRRLGDILGPNLDRQYDMDLGAPPNCKCGMNAVLRHVRKAGPNEGKAFYVCSMPQGSQCNFWEWADAVGKEGVTAAGDTSELMTSMNVCYRCNEPGHFAKECPQSIKKKGNYAGGRGGSSSSKLKCYKCGENGHYANACPTIVMYM